MNYSDEQLRYLAEQAVTAAKAAGGIINAHRQGDVRVHHKATGSSEASQVVTEVDHKAEAAIVEILKSTCGEYDLALLTEEGPDSGERHRRSAFWSVDPMDGTLAFIKRTSGYTVSIALVERDGTPLIGVVYDPLGDVLFEAVRGRGVHRNGEPFHLPDFDSREPLILCTDNSFRQHPWLESTYSGLQTIASGLGLKGAEIHFSIGAVMNACRVLEMPNTCYFKYPRGDNSGGSLWDYGATACLFHEAGGVASDIYGEPMDLNRVDSTFMNYRGVLYAGHQSLAEAIRSLFSDQQGHL